MEKLLGNIGNIWRNYWEIVGTYGETIGKYWEHIGKIQSTGHCSMGFP
jgi:hypothetical protein